MSDMLRSNSGGSRTEPPPGSTPRSPLFVILLVAGVFYAGIIGMHLGPYATGSDAAGYLNLARQIKFGQITVPQRSLGGHLNDPAHNMLYVPLGFHPTDSSHMTGTYPIGLPLFLAIGAEVVSWHHTAKWVIWTHSLAGLALLYVFARQCRFSSGWASLAVLLMAMSPLYILYSLVLMSDVPATVWTLAAMICAVRGRQSVRWALAAGVFTGFAVLIRPSNALILPAAVIALGLTPRRLLAYALGGAPLAVVYFGYNTAAHISVLTGGYGDLANAFGAEYVGPTLVHYAIWLPVLLTPVGLLALGLPWVRHKEPRLTAVLAIWILAYAGFYLFYSFTHQTWWFLRFLLPAFPAIWIAALLVTRTAIERFGAKRFTSAGHLRLPWLGLVAAGAIFIYDFCWNNVLTTLGAGENERTYPEAVEWLRHEVPPNAAVVAMQMSGTLLYSSDFLILRWDYLDAGNFQRVMAAAASAGRPVVALLKQNDIEELQGSHHLFGTWTRLGTAYETEIWRYDGGADAPYTLRGTDGRIAAVQRLSDH